MPEGWFEDTLPVLRNETFAVVRLDGDLYGSTMTSLANLYPALSPGGFVIVDDYGDHQWAAGQAVDDYRSEHGIDDPLHRVGGACVFWRRRAGSSRTSRPPFPALHGSSAARRRGVGILRCDKVE